MKNKVFCKTTAKGVHSFYIKNDEGCFFLFSQSYRKGVSEYFRCGISLDDAIDFSRSRNNDALKRTMYKLPMYIRYVEKEYGIEILEQTKKKNAKAGRKAIVA